MDHLHVLDVGGGTVLNSGSAARRVTFVKMPNNEQCLFVVQFGDLDLVRRARVGKRSVELFIQRLDGIEDLREHKFEQQPELRKVVL